MRLSCDEKSDTCHTRSCVPLWRLLWKEFRERRWWALTWALLLLAVSLFAQGRWFCGGVGLAPTPWNYLPLLLAGVVGLGGYSSELRRGRALFLFSHPVRWQQVLLAKLLFGAIIAFGAPLLAVCLFRLTCPAPYRALVTLPHVITGVMALALPPVLCYLCGLACSVILPGLAGAAVTLTGAGITLLLTLLSSEYIVSLWHSTRLPSDTSPEVKLMSLGMHVGIVFFATLGILCGGVSAAQRGVYHDYPRRLKRFAFAFMLAMLIGGIAGLNLPRTLAENVLLQRIDSVSPGGSYDIISYQVSCDFMSGFAMDNYRTDIFRQVDHALLHRASVGQGDVIAANNWLWLTDAVAYSPQGKGVLLYHPVTGKVIRSSGFGIPSPISPDGRFTVNMVYINPMDSNPEPFGKSELHFCNLDNGKTKDVFISRGGYEMCGPVWWKSINTVGYYRFRGFYGHPANPKNHQPEFHEEVDTVRVPEF